MSMVRQTEDWEDRCPGMSLRVLPSAQAVPTLHTSDPDLVQESRRPVLESSARAHGPGEALPCELRRSAQQNPVAHELRHPASNSLRDSLIPARAATRIRPQAVRE